MKESPEVRAAYLEGKHWAAKMVFKTFIFSLLFWFFLVLVGAAPVDAILVALWALFVLASFQWCVELERGLAEVRSIIRTITEQIAQLRGS